MKCINFKSGNSNVKGLNEHFRIQKHRHLKQMNLVAYFKLSYQGHMVDA